MPCNELRRPGKLTAGVNVMLCPSSKILPRNLVWASFYMLSFTIKLARQLIIFAFKLKIVHTKYFTVSQTFGIGIGIGVTRVTAQTPTNQTPGTRRSRHGVPHSAITATIPIECFSKNPSTGFNGEDSAKLVAIIHKPFRIKQVNLDYPGT